MELFWSRLIKSIEPVRLKGSVLSFHWVLFLHQGPLLFTWFKFNLSMDKYLHPLQSVRWKYLVIPKLQQGQFRCGVPLNRLVFFNVVPQKTKDPFHYLFLLIVQILWKLDLNIIPFFLLRSLTHWGLVMSYGNIYVNIGSGNGLTPNGTQPLPEPILMHHQWSQVALFHGHFHIS